LKAYKKSSSLRAGPTMQFISSSSRKLWAGPQNTALYGSPVRSMTPDDPCALVGNRNRCAVEPTPLPKLIDHALNEANPDGEMATVQNSPLFNSRNPARFVR
jgi:hypothetical protein